jgi:hypothetical protein
LRSSNGPVGLIEHLFSFWMGGKGRS